MTDCSPWTPNKWGPPDPGAVAGDDDAILPESVEEREHKSGRMKNVCEGGEENQSLCRAKRYG